MVGYKSMRNIYLLRSVVHLDGQFHGSFADMLLQSYPTLLLKSSYDNNQLLVWLHNLEEYEYIAKVCKFSGLPPNIIESLHGSVFVMESEEFLEEDIYDSVFLYLCDNNIPHRFKDGKTKLCISITDHMLELVEFFQDVGISFEVYSSGFNNFCDYNNDIFNMIEPDYMQLKFFGKYICDDSFVDPITMITWNSCEYIFKFTATLSRAHKIEMAHLCVSGHPFIMVKDMLGYPVTQFWVADLDDFFFLRRTFADKDIVFEISDIPYHKLVMSSTFFKPNKAVMYNILSKNSAPFTVLSDDFTIMLDNATDYFYLHELFDECSITVHLKSIEIVDCRPGCMHNFPELDISEPEPIINDTSNETWQTLSSDSDMFSGYESVFTENN